MVDTSLFLWPASGFEAEPEGWWAGLFCMGAWLWVREIEWVGRDWISSWACWWRKHPPCNIFHPAYRHTTIQNNISNNIIFLQSLFINWTHPCWISINFFQKKLLYPCPGPLDVSQSRQPFWSVGVWWVRSTLMHQRCHLYKTRKQIKHR